MEAGDGTEEETFHLYNRKYAPPIDLVVLVKYLLVGFLYGIPSERRIEQRIQADTAPYWYLCKYQKTPGYTGNV